MLRPSLGKSATSGDATPAQDVDPLLFVMMRVVDEGLLARRDAHEVDAGSQKAVCEKVCSPAATSPARMRVRVFSMSERITQIDRGRERRAGAHVGELHVAHVEAEREMPIERVPVEAAA